MDCSCNCGPSAHAPVADFGIAMCLSPGCDCDGPKEHVLASRLQRAIRLSPIAEQLYNCVFRVLNNDAATQRVVTAIVSNFEVEAR